MPSISVIVPAYNEEKRLARTLKSLRDQTFKDYELIVVDNNSKDRTNEIAKKFADRVVVEKKKGYTNAVNKGVKLSSFELITFCDADTLYPNDWLMKMVKHFDDEVVVAVYGPCKFYDHNSVINFISHISSLLWMNTTKLLGWHSTPGFNFVMRKKAYLKVGGYDSKIYNDILLDVELGKRLKQVGRLVSDASVTVLTSSRRYRGDGLVRTALYHIDAFIRLGVGKNQKINYTQYNKVFD